MDKLRGASMALRHVVQPCNISFFVIKTVTNSQQATTGAVFRESNQCAVRFSSVSGNVANAPVSSALASA